MKPFKIGDRVTFMCLTKGGCPKSAQWGQKIGFITQIKEAGKLGARAMDCTKNTLIHWVDTGDSICPKLACELKLYEASTTRD